MNVQCALFIILFIVSIFDCRLHSHHIRAKCWTERHAVLCHRRCQHITCLKPKRVSPVTRARIHCLTAVGAQYAQYPYHLNVSHGSREWASFDEEKKKRKLFKFLLRTKCITFIHPSHSVWNAEIAMKKSFSKSICQFASDLRKRKDKFHVAQVHHNSFDVRMHHISRIIIDAMQAHVTRSNACLAHNVLGTQLTRNIHYPHISFGNQNPSLTHTHTLDAPIICILHPNCVVVVVRVVHAEMERLTESGKVI